MSVYGVTKCPECRRFFAASDEVVVRVVEEFPWRQSSSGHAYRSLTPVKVQQRIHGYCLREVDRFVRRARALAEVDRFEAVEAIATDAGLPIPSDALRGLESARAELVAIAAEGVADLNARSAAQPSTSD